MNSSTGKAMKATLKPGLFEFEDFDPKNTDSNPSALRVMEEKLLIPLERYVCPDLDALKTMEPGSAKGKGIPDLIQMGMSLLDSIQTNLPLVQVVSIFQMVYSEKDQGIEVDYACKPGSTPDWKSIRATLNQALATTINLI